jgi:predicted nucleotidyltransferase
VEKSYVQPADPRAWIASLPDPIARQANVLHRLFDAFEADPHIRAFRVRGSIARGTADEYSDIDTRIWISDEDYETTVALLPRLLRSIAPTLDILFETPGSPYLFVQFADGVQLELSTGRASEATDRDSNVVVLLDRDGMWNQPDEPTQPWDQGLWLGWAWMALSDIDKHLRRGSLWEARTSLERARSLLLCHHAAVSGIHDPQYGVTSILDYGGSRPPGLESTVAGLDTAEIRRAALACGRLLATYERRPFAEYVLERLTCRDLPIPAATLPAVSVAAPSRVEASDAPAIYLITGPMAAGKTTVARSLASRFERGVHVEGDVFRRSIVSGREEVTPDLAQGAMEQLRLRYRLAAGVADGYVEAGFSVALEDVVAGSFLEEWPTLIRSGPCHVIVLLPSVEAIMTRASARAETGYGAWTPDQLHSGFATGTPRIGLWLDTTNLTVEETVNEILAQTISGTAGP